MASVTHPRGRLPRRVYWVRRAVVLGVALLLVFSIGKLIGSTGSDPTAIKASTSSATGAVSGAQNLAIGPFAPARVGRQQKATVPLVAPNGECADDEVSVVPTVPRAWAGGPISIRLDFQGTQPACTFKVSPQSLVVKVASGSDRIWSTQDCPQAVPVREVVVRSGASTVLPITWSGRRSEAGCASLLAWALPGFYHVYAAALGSTPGDVQFEITRAATRVITRAPKPTVSPSATASRGATASPSATATPKKRTAKPTSSPSPTAAGKGSKCGGDNAAGSC